MQDSWEIEWQDYYEILQVHPSAEPEVIEAAYRRLTRKYHPDVNKDPAANERMTKLNVAHEVLSDPEKRKRYHSAWLRKSGMPDGGQGATVENPKPTVDPPHIRFSNVEPGEIKRASFIIRNLGGPYSKIWFSNPDSWVRVVHWDSLTASDELPLKVEIEAEGEDWGKSYLAYIRVKLDEEETQVRIALRTTPEPVKEKVWVGGIPKAKPAYTPPPVTPPKGFPTWGKWSLGLVVCGLIGYWLVAGALIGQVETPIPSGKIVFVVGRKIYSMNTDGTNRVALLGTNPVVLLGTNVWFNTEWGSSARIAPSPDGNEIVIENLGRINVMAFDGSNQRQLSGNWDFEPSWFPDGSKIIFVRRCGKASSQDRIITMKPDGTNQQELKLGAEFIELLRESERPSLSTPVISPDGQKVAFGVEELISVNEDYVGFRETIYVMYLNGTNLGVVARRSGVFSRFVWAPDSKHLLYVRHDGEVPGRYDVYTKNIYEGDEKLLISDANYPSPSPDGNWVVFSDWRGILWEYSQYIVIASLDGKVEKRLGEGSRPVWMP